MLSYRGCVDCIETGTTHQQEGGKNRDRAEEIKTRRALLPVTLIASRPEGLSYGGASRPGERAYRGNGIVRGLTKPF